MRILSHLNIIDISHKQQQQQQQQHKSCANVDPDKLRKVITKGQMRFAPETKERSIKTQIRDLNSPQLECFEHLKHKWQLRYPDEPFSDEMILRFARCSPSEPFDAKSAWKVMKKYSRRYDRLNAYKLERQLRTKTAFPLPGVHTKNGESVFYMRPSRYIDKQTPTHLVIDNLVYVVNSLVEREKCCSEGVGFIANMDGWNTQNVS
jgi:hypothetical protein